MNVLTTIRSPSVKSDMSRAALTLIRSFKAVNFRSNSPIADIHGSPTSVSSMSVARGGGMQKSTSKFESGFSIFWTSVSN